MPKTNRTSFVLMLLSVAALDARLAADDATAYRVLATNKTSTMQKEMQEAASAGFRFVAVMGGETSLGGKEVVVLMQKAAGMARREYRLPGGIRSTSIL